MVTPAAKRKAVAHLRVSFGMSERRAGKAIGCCRMTMRYQTLPAFANACERLPRSAAVSATDACMFCSSGRVM